MTEGRCDLVLLGWTAFVGFNLVSDFLWSGSGNQGNQAGDVGMLGGVTGVVGVSQALFQGNYRLRSNGTAVDSGTMWLTMVSQPTAAVSVRIIAMAMDFSQQGGFGALAAGQADLRFTGVEFMGAEKITATGQSDPSKPSGKIFGPRSCRLDAAVTLERQKVSTGQRSLPEGTPQPFGSLVGEIVALGCGSKSSSRQFTLSFDVNAIDILYATQKVVHYSIWVNVLTLLQIRSFLVQMRHTEDGPAATKVSILCIVVQVFMDAYDSFLHLCLGLSSQYMFSTVAIVALFKFILFSVVEARYFLIVWRQRRNEVFSQGWEVVRRELSWMYSRFYGALVLGLVLIYKNLRHLDIIVLVFQTYWLPQILHDAWQGSRSALRPDFVAIISCTRVLHVLYLWGCPEGIFHGELFPRLAGAPSLTVCVTAVLLQMVQLGVMYLQKSRGPRWFIPWICMPQAYNYYRDVRIDAGSECVICMSEIDTEEGRRVVTPCSHAFHSTCLEQWLDVKMECPTCRESLPPILQ